MIQKLVSEVLPLLAWMLLWTVGGWWIARSAFNLRPNEQALVGFGMGMFLQNFFANLLGQVMPVPVAFWAAAALIPLIGLALSYPFSNGRWRELYRIPIHPWQWVGLVALTYVLTLTGRGLSILDDYQNLPTVSILAAGDIPPHFPLDPNVVFSYHYSTLLFAAQMMRIGGMQPWDSLDLARGMGLALGIITSGFWVQRITGSAMAAFTARLMTAFSGGTRWLLLLLPVSLLKQLSSEVHLIGSGLATAPDLFTALTKPLGLDGGGPFPFPFAYSNAFNTAAIWTYHAGATSLGGSYLILTHNRWRGWKGMAVISVMLGASALRSETGFITLLGGMVFVAVIYALLNRTVHLPRSLWNWLIALIPATLIALVQGGVLTGIASDFASRLSGTEAAGGNAYFSFSFSLLSHPTLISGHLGLLKLTEPLQLLAALAEMGPLIVVLPLALLWGWKAFRANRWYEAMLVATPLLGLITLFLSYTGNAGPTALTRVQTGLISLCTTFAVPTLWLWAGKRSNNAKGAVATLLFVSIFGGMVLFGTELIAAPKPVYGYFLNDLDAAMQARHWNTLPEDALVFDSTPSRAPTVLGRHTDTHITWYKEKPEWKAVASNPTLTNLRQYGFTHLYLDKVNWDEHEKIYQQIMLNPCVKKVDEVLPKRGVDFRLLLDISACPVE